MIWTQDLEPRNHFLAFYGDFKNIPAGIYIMFSEYWVSQRIRQPPTDGEPKLPQSSPLDVEEQGLFSKFPLKLNPATAHKNKVILSTWIENLVLSVMIHIS